MKLNRIAAYLAAEAVRKAPLKNILVTHKSGRCQVEHMSVGITRVHTYHMHTAYMPDGDMVSKGCLGAK